jgi:hypothetical protein
MNRDCTVPYLCHFLGIFLLFVVVMLTANSWLLDVVFP